MLKSVLIVVAMVMQFGCSDNFTVVANDNSLMSLGTECLNVLYEGYSDERGATIPDAYPAGTTLGPLRISGNGGVIQGVVLSLEISHPHTADVHTGLHYDADNDGVYEASSPVEIYLARSDPCDGEELWACPVELSGDYFFRDESWGDFGETASFKVYEGLPSGGSFYLTVADTLEGDIGVVKSWGVFVEKAVHLAHE